MRFELCAAITLLAGNLLLDRGDAGAPASAPPSVVASHVEHDPAEAARLAALWLANNAGHHPRACAYRDPLAILDADVDPAPGREHVIGNRRFGVAMYAERGELLARMEPIGCDQTPADVAQDQSISISYASGHLIIRARTAMGGPYAGSWIDGHLVERRDDKLVTVATLLLDGDLRGHTGAWQAEGRIHAQADGMLVKYHGRQRGDGEARWRAVDEHCTFTRRDGMLVPDDPNSMCQLFAR